MDHLIAASDPVHGVVEVPYLPDERWIFDGLDFISFPARKDLDIIKVRRGDFGDLSEREVLSFIQSWLFFGLIKSAFAIGGISPDVHDFIVESEGRQMVSTKLIPDYLTAWMYRNRAFADAASAISQRHQLEVLLNHAAQILVIIAWRDEPQLRGQPIQRSTSLKEAVLTSCDILVHTFTHAFDIFAVPLLDCIDDQVVHKISGGTRPQCAGSMPSMTAYMRRRFKDAGWCPYTVSKLKETFEGCPCALYMASDLRSTYREGDSHENCQPGQCLKDRTDENMYAPSHRDACQCKSEDSFPGIIPDRVTLVTFDGGEIQSGTVKSESLNVNGASGDDEVPLYVAISHVWSDGLGNPGGNSLPLCQLEYIQRSVNALFLERTQPIPFWIDTLCVNVKDATIRRQTIVHMRWIYERAAKVLVFESSLTNCHAPKSAVEVQLRVALSRWPLRLWTKQEGDLAQELYFQFKDKAVRVSRESVIGPEATDKLIEDARHALERIPDGKSKIADYEYISSKSKSVDKGTIGRFVTTANPIFSSTIIAISRCISAGKQFTIQHDRTPTPLLTSLIEAIRNRSTTRLTDETICYSSLIGGDTKTYVTLDPSDRLKAFVRSFKRVPPALIFGDIKRHTDPGYRWLPCSLLSASMLGARDQFESASVHDDGLHCEFPGIWLFPPETEADCDGLGMTLAHRTARVRFLLQTHERCFVVGSANRERSFEREEMATDFAVILSYARMGGGYPFVTHGVLVSILGVEKEGEEVKVVTCRREGSLKLVEHREEDLRGMEVNFVLDGLHMGEKQRWVMI